jgi:hypothetical protein
MLFRKQLMRWQNDAGVTGLGTVFDTAGSRFVGRICILLAAWGGGGTGCTMAFVEHGCISLGGMMRRLFCNGLIVFCICGGSGGRHEGWQPLMGSCPFVIAFNILSIFTLSSLLSSSSSKLAILN